MIDRLAQQIADTLISSKGTKEALRISRDTLYAVSGTSKQELWYCVLQHTSYHSEVMAEMEIIRCYQTVKPG